MSNSLDIAKEYIKDHEGLRLRVYKDSLGFLTIGFGHKLLPGEKFKVITRQQADELFEKDFVKHFNEAKAFPGYSDLDGTRQIVILDMVYNMGGNFYKKWPKFTKYMQEGKFKLAANEILTSKYYKQTGRRAKNNIKLLLS